MGFIPGRAGWRLLLLAVACSVAAAEENDLGRVKTLRVVTRQAYGGARFGELPQVASCARSLLAGAGLQVVGADAKAFDGTLTVTVKGKAIDARVVFDRPCACAAQVTGELAFDFLPGLGARAFSGQADPPRHSRYLGEGIADDAVFVRAFCAGFVPTLAKTVASLWKLDEAQVVAGALKDPDEGVRRQAAASLGELRSPAATAPLLAALSDPSALVRREAALALGPMGQEATGPLVLALKDPDGGVRAATARALGRRGDRAATLPLATALGDPDWHVQAEAASALSALKDERAIPALRDLLQERPAGRLFHPPAEEEADLAEADEQIAERTSHIVQRRALGALARMGEPAFGALTTILRDDGIPSLIRAQAAKALGALGRPQAVQPLATALAGNEPDLQAAAAEALGALGGAAVDTLLDALRVQDASTRRATVRALARVADPRIIEPLCLLLKSEPDDWVRTNVATTLGKLKDKRALDPLRAALKDNHPGVRDAAAEALHALGAAESIEDLAARLKDPDSDVRQRAAETLGRLRKTEGVGPLLAALKHPDAKTRIGAAAALGCIGDPTAVDGLIAALEEKEFYARHAVEEALARITGKEFRDIGQWRDWWKQNRDAFLKGE